MSVHEAADVTHVWVWLSLLDEAEQSDLLDLEKTFIVLLESHSADDVHRAGLSSVELCGLIDLLHEVSYFMVLNDAHLCL